jgi:hypothetical protein
MSKWRFGCGCNIEVTVQRGYGHTIKVVECGSTAYDGGINQCEECEIEHPYSMPDEDEGDLEWFDRQGCE